MIIPESLHIHRSPPNFRLRAFRDSFPIHSMLKLHQSEDPFETLTRQDDIHTVVRSYMTHEPENDYGFS